MFRRADRSAGPRRHKSGSLVLPADVAARLAPDGRALLGAFSEAQVAAAGVLSGIGPPGLDETASPLTKLPAAEREAAVAAARADEPGPVLVLLEQVFASYHFLARAIATDLAYGFAGVMRVSRMAEVITEEGHSLLLEQRLDVQDGRTEVVLWTPGAAALELAREAWTDPAGERPDGPGSALSVLQLSCMWGTPKGPRATVLSVRRLEGSAEAELRTEIDGSAMPVAVATQPSLQEAVLNLFDSALVAA
jgi:hypothetical protein